MLQRSFRALNSARAERASMQTSNSIRGKILVVDRNPELGIVMSAALNAQGYDVCVSEPERGLQAAREQQPILICLHAAAPERGAFNLVRALKQDPELQRVPLVVMQASGSNSGAPDRATPETWLTRPFAAPLLLAAIQKVLRSRLSVN